MLFLSLFHIERIFSALNQTRLGILNMLIDGTLPYEAKAVCGAGSLEAQNNYVCESIGQGE
jgi:hypothetical protein